MEGVDYVDLTLEARRKAEKRIRRHRIIKSIIENKKMDLEPSMTAQYKIINSQPGNQFHSDTEKLALARMDLEELEHELRKLNFIYECLTLQQKAIWEERYLMGKSDVQVFINMNISESTYYRLKRRVVEHVVNHFGLMAVS